MILSHEGVLQVVNPLFTKISSSSLTFSCSQVVTLRWFFMWMNVSTQTDHLLHLSTVRSRSSDCWQLHFKPASARLFSTPSLSIVWSNYQICSTIFTDFFEVWLHYRRLYHGKCSHAVEITTFNSVDLSSTILHWSMSWRRRSTSMGVWGTDGRFCLWEDSVCMPRMCLNPRLSDFTQSNISAQYP